MNHIRVRSKAGYADAGYVYVAPSQGNGISGTQVRKGMSDSDEKSRTKFFKSVYPKFNQKIFDLVSSKILRSEEVMESFLQSINLNSILTENSTATGIGGNSQGVDDGPGAFYGNMKTFKKEMEDVVGTLGWNIVTYLMDEDDMESFTDTEYPTGPGRYPVSFFPSGKAGLDALASEIWC